MNFTDLFKALAMFSIYWVAGLLCAVSIFGVAHLLGGS